VEDHGDCGHGTSADDDGVSLRFEMELRGRGWGMCVQIRQDVGLVYDLIEEELDADVKEAEIGVSYV
jgi:hypothetical protein